MNRRRAITFEPSSLYISTQALVDGSFHWSFFVTDSDAIVQRHHWAKKSGSTSTYSVVESNFSSNSLSKQPLAESYEIQTFKDPRLTAPYAENTPFLAYFKVNGYTPPRNPEVFSHICSNAFPYSYASVKENRANGLSCQSWILKVLGDLWASGIIKGRTDDVPRIEEKIVRSSQSYEGQYLQCFLRQEVYSSAMIVL